MVSLDGGSAPTPEQYPFRDRRIALELAQGGYVVVPFLDTHELAEVRRIRSTYGPPPDDPRTGFFSDAWSDDRDYRRTVSTELLSSLGPALARLTERHQVLAAAHLVKWPTPESPVTPHRDPSFVDERAHRSVTVWCPLTGSNEVQGGLMVVDRSHLGAQPTRPHDDPVNLSPWVADGPDGTATLLELEPGDAILFDHALVHGSAANVGQRERVSVAVLLAPVEADPEYALLAEGGTVEVVSVGPSFFLEHQFHALDVSHILSTQPRVRSEPVAPNSHWEPATHVLTADHATRS